MSVLSTIPKLWGDDPECMWTALRWGVSPALFYLAPGSAGYGLDRVPPEGGAVLAANHLAAIDHPLIGIFSPRTIFFMAKAELVGMPVVGELLTWTGVFPVRRGEADRAQRGVELVDERQQVVLVGAAAMQEQQQRMREIVRPHLDGAMRQPNPSPEDALRVAGLLGHQQAERKGILGPTA